MTALDILRQMAIDDHKKKYPLSWDGDRSKTYFSPKYSDKTEKGLVKCILDFLKFEGHQAERINNKGTRVDERQVVENVIGQMKTIGRVRWNYSQQERGTADISATILKQFGSQKIGVSVKIELKLPGDRMRPAQIEYKAKIEKAGGVYVISSSFNDFFNWYNSFVENF